VIQLRLGSYFLLALFAAALPAAGQTAPPQNPAEMTTHEETVTFKTAVNVVNVPVVVRDSKGQAVGNLTKEDFQLFDRGKLQTISKFTVEKAEGKETMVPAPAEPGQAKDVEVAAPAVPTAVLPERFIGYLFDDVHVSNNDLAMARDAADRHMKTVLGPKVRAGIYTTSGQTMLDFTDDAEKLHEALYRLQPHPIADAVMRECPDLTYFWADRIRNQNDQEALRMAILDAQACSADQQSASMLVNAAIGRVIARYEHTAQVSLQVLRNAVQRMSVMPGKRTLVLVSPGFLTLIGSKNEESVIIDRAIRANVVINALDVRGLATEAKDVSRTTGALQGTQLSSYVAYREQMDHEVFNAQSDVMAEVAAGTGGTFYHNSNDLVTGFQRVAGAPEYLYVLSFSPQNLKMDGTVHTLKVALAPNPHHYDLDARRSYTAPKRLDDPVEAAKQEITDAIFSREEMRDIPLELHTEFFKAAPDRVKLTVVTHVDLKPLKLRKAEGRNRDDLTVTTGIFDNNGNYVVGIQRGVELRLKDETFDKWIANGVTVRSNLEVKPGTYLVRVVVRDSEGQLMAARNGSVDIP
jgi:VWFA-related protein